MRFDAIFYPGTFTAERRVGPQADDRIRPNDELLKTLGGWFGGARRILLMVFGTCGRWRGVVG